jgi:hypothetical protein
MIRVQGTILNGLEGGPWLSGEKCKSHTEVKGETFPNIIQLEDPQDTVRRLHAVDFQLDESAMANFQKMLSRLHPKIEELRVTIIGMFETRAPLADLVQELGGVNSFV